LARSDDCINWRPALRCLSRERVKQRYSAVGDYHLDVAALAILVVGLFVSAIDHLQSQRSIDALKSKTDYSEVARLNMQGKPFPDGDIAFNSPLSRMMDGTYKLAGNTLTFYRTADAETQLRKVIANYPDFPFAHYGLALCLRGRGDRGWRAEIERAKEIFQVTTSIPGHQPDHDDALKRINQIIEQ
jgi:hypothetical protein